MNNKNSDNKPLVSVVVTTYNRPDKCKRALRSVDSQNYENLQIIVVEDGTTTDIEGWINTNLPSVTYIRHQTNKGLAAARNTGLDTADGEYVAYLDDDDKWKSKRISKQIKAIQSLDKKTRQEVGVVYCGVEQRATDGSFITANYPQNEGRLKDSIMEVGASTLPSSFLFRREALVHVGGFDEQLPSSVDHDIWMSLAVHDYNVISVDDPLVITYVENDPAMTNNTIPRIHGVKMFVEKWKPTYQTWMGEERGSRYAEEYFVRVISRLAANKLCGGLYFEFGQSACAIFSESPNIRYNLVTLVSEIISIYLVSILPDNMINILSKIKERLR